MQKKHREQKQILLVSAAFLIQFLSHQGIFIEYPIFPSETH